MSESDFRAQRLYVPADLVDGALVRCEPAQHHYVKHVLRLSPGDRLLLFNGRHGEWDAEITVLDRKQCQLVCRNQTRPQTSGPDLVYLFAPLKRARLDYMVQKATEMGVARLQPVLTHRTVVRKVKRERMHANVIEAAEQCGILRVPEIGDLVPLPQILENWEADRALVYCDELAPVSSPLSALKTVPKGPVAVLIGPEGGFTPAEREMLRLRDFVTPISLGPRIMRADTAAVAALALVNACLGDW